MTLDGYYHFIVSSNVISRVLWLLITIACTILMIQSIIAIANQLASHEMITKFEAEKISSDMRFPSVTICNANPVNASELSSDEANVRLNPELLVDEMIGNPSKFMTPLLQWRMSNDTEEQTRSFFEPESCTFSNQDCSFDTHFINTPGYSNCFTFNSNGTLNQSRPGTVYSLSLVVNIDIQNHLNFMPMLMHNGVYVTLHDPGRLSHIVTHSYIAGPGQLTRFEIKRRDMTRLQSPYKDNCTNGYNTRLLTARWYTEEACLMSCQVEKILDECNCVDAYTRAFVKEATGISLTKCTETENVCFKRTVDSILESELNCDCPMLCEESSYNVQVTSAPWPSDINHSVLNAKLKSKRNRTRSLQYVQTNYVALQIYYKDFTIEKVIHVPAYGAINFLADLGGITNLWLGASICTAFEIIVFLLQALILKVTRSCKSAEVDPDESNKTKEIVNINLENLSLEDL